ncbi:hypothetical protein SUNI508_12252 [Seiridium unicorne]|uniref:N-acetylgalactosaminide beta-1,3-galactosyltransferase n=1 Tax=Seiridium unicorne TaxID=138068 RepID=A0ABR2UEI6_9PEZI
MHPALRLLGHRIPVLLTLPVILTVVYLLHTFDRSPQVALQSCEPGSNQPAQAAGPASSKVPTALDSKCKAFPDPGNLQVTIKTGATEAYEKLLPQLMTSLGCSQRVEIFSDLEETIGTYHLHDALKDFDAEMKLTHPDFEVYRLQQEYQATGQDISELAKKHKIVWNLDRYKFMHMVQKTWELNPGLDWYLFVESDTYVFWANFNTWLRRLDPSKKLYLGSEAQIWTQWFAHGGSGFVLSGALLQQFVGEDKQMASRNDKVLIDACCGDMILARAIQKYTGVEVQNNWPWINGESPWTIPFGPNYWCKPIITFHHIQPRQRALIWNFEQKRKNPDELLLFEEMSQLAFPDGKLHEQLEDWDNLSEVLVTNPSGQPHTLDSCKHACNFRDDCWQYLYSDGECYLSGKGFRMGFKKPPIAGRRWISGWKPEKIEAFRKDNVCKEPEWREDDYPVRDSIF